MFELLSILFTGCKNRHVMKIKDLTTSSKETCSECVVGNKESVDIWTECVFLEKELEAEEEDEKRARELAHKEMEELKRKELERLEEERQWKEEQERLAREAAAREADRKRLEEVRRSEQLHVR